MRYQDGQSVQLGDKVYLGGDHNGVVVVGIIDECAYAKGHSHALWGFLGSGLILKTSFGDWHIDAPDEDMELLERQP